MTATMRKLLLLGALVIGVLAVAAPAWAQTEGYGEVGGIEVSAPPTPAAAPAPRPTQVAAAPQASGGLAFTGADVAGTVVVGLALIGLGVVLVRRGRAGDTAA